MLLQYHFRNIFSIIDTEKERYGPQESILMKVNQVKDILVKKPSDKEIV